MSACTPRVRVYDYPKLNLRVIRASKHDVERVCENKKARCCTLVKARIIWISTPYCLTHELEHLEGGNEEQALEHDWGIRDKDYF